MKSEIKPTEFGPRTQLEFASLDGLNPSGHSTQAEPRAAAPIPATGSRAFFRSPSKERVLVFLCTEFSRWSISYGPGPQTGPSCCNTQPSVSGVVSRGTPAQVAPDRGRGVRQHRDKLVWHLWDKKFWAPMSLAQSLMWRQKSLLLPQWSLNNFALFIPTLCFASDATFGVSCLNFC